MRQAEAEPVGGRLVVGLQILRELSDGHPIRPRHDDAPLDRGALALLQDAPSFLLLRRLARFAA